MTSSISTGEPTPHETTDDEQSRLSRRSSVLNDLFSLFRRSSSFHLRSQNKLWFSDREGDEDEEVDEDGTPRISKDRILEMIQQKKEIIAKLREEPWKMSRKRKALIVAQKHLKKQQAKVSKVQLIRTDMSRGMKQFSRLFANFRIYLIPWEAKIKKIESHFGSVVSSYFTFLRWVLGFNLLISLIMGIFVIVPEWLADAQGDPVRQQLTALRKVMPPNVTKRANSISTIMKLEGYFEYSYLFYGYYSPLNFNGETVKYRIPLAYFLANIAIIALSFVWILRKMAENARTSKLSSGKTEQYVFNWKCFTGWDFTIGNTETATNVAMANVIKFREAIAEYNVKQKGKLTCCLGMTRAFTNLLVAGMLSFSVWAIYNTSMIESKDTFFSANAVSITISIISLVYPNLFDLIGILEKHHPKFALKLQLCRVLVLYIVNYITLFLSLYKRLTDLENKQLSNMYEHSNQLEFERQRNASLMPSYDVYHSRMIRDLLMPLSNLTYSYSSAPILTTTPAPTLRKPWTTVLPDFGPFGVSAPRAVVTPNEGLHRVKTQFTAHAIGPMANWTVPAVLDLNYNRSRVGSSITTTFETPSIGGRSSADCWETVMGQEITNIVVVDMFMTVGSILLIDFIRGLGVRYLNIFCCWNLETTFPEYGEFKVAENVLHLANNQGMVWLGLFFVPLLPVINNIKLIIIMYIRGWACMTCNVPAKQIFRASRSNNFFLGLLLFMLFMSMIPFGFVIASKKPSKTCGPFAGQEHFYSVITNTMTEYLNDQAVSIVKAVISPGIIIPIIVFLLLVIYFLFSLVRGLREANDDLTTQLTHERTEEKKKIFELAGGKHNRGGGRGRAGSFFFNFTKDKKKPKAVVVKKTGGSGSENDDSTRSLPRSTTSITNKFVPSLGSVSEVEHSDSEDSERGGEKTAERNKSTSMHPEGGGTEGPEGGVKLTLKQKFLICIGWADPKKYTRIPLEDIEAGAGERGEEEEESEEEGERRQRKEEEKRQLLSGSSQSTSGESSDEEEEEDDRTGSFQTASQGIEQKRDRSTTASVSRKLSYTNRSRPLDVEYATPSLASPTTGESGRSTGSSASSNTSNSHSGGYRRNPRYLEVAHSSGSPSDSRHSPPLYQNHKPTQHQRTRKKSGKKDERDADESFAGDVSTRPPSQDGSFRDDVPAPHSSSEENAPHLHSSYTSAMLSPIMARVVFPVNRERSEESEEESGGERAPLVPPHGSPSSHHHHHHHGGHHNQGQPTAVRVSRDPDSHRAYITRPPRFRISSSPPKTPNSETRKFEVHVCSSPKTSRTRGRPPPPPPLTSTSSSSRKEPTHEQTEV